VQDLNTKERQHKYIKKKSSQLLQFVNNQFSFHTRNIQWQFHRRSSWPLPCHFEHILYVLILWMILDGTRESFATLDWHKWNKKKSKCWNKRCTDL